MGRESGNKRKFASMRKEEEGTHGMPADSAQPPQQQGGRKKKSKQDPSQLSPAEIERRNIQRELREIALKVKASGGQYKPQKFKRKVYKEHGVEVGTHKTKEKRDKKKQRATPSWRPYGKVDVVIIPIYWNIKSRLAEKEIVMRAASKVAERLGEAGIATHTDDANAYTPGQKMKYWETAGVLVRVEIGPKEAQNGTAVVALANEPGTVAQKETVNVELRLLSEVWERMEQAQARLGKGGKAGKEERKRQQAKQEELIASQSQGDAAQDMEQAENGDEGGERDGSGEGSSGSEGSEGSDEGGEEMQQNGGPGGGGSQRQTGGEGGSVEAESEGEGGDGSKGESGDESEGGSGSGSEQEEEEEGGEGGSESEGKDLGSLSESSSGDEEQQGQQQQRKQLQQHEQQQGSGGKKKAAAAAGAAPPSGAAALQMPTKASKRAAGASGGAAQGQEQGVQPAKKGKKQQQEQQQPSGCTQGQEQGAQPAKKGKKQEAQPAKKGKQQQEQQQQEQPSASTVQPPVGGGDELEDDFEIEPQFMPEPEEEELAMSKSERLKQARKNDKAWRKQKKSGGEAKGWDDSGAGKEDTGSHDIRKQKKPKLVVF